MKSRNPKAAPRAAALALAAPLLAPAAFAAAQDAAGLYLSTDFGLASAFGATAIATGANRPTRCDRLLYADPANAPTDPECASGLADSRQGEFGFDRGSGRAQALALGYAAGAFRFEAEVLLRQQVGTAAPFSVGGDRSLTGKDNEWSALAEPNADIYNFRSTQIFANALRTLASRPSWTLYVGVGGGLAKLDFGFYKAFHRKSIAEGYLEAFGGSKSNPDAAPEWQRAAAGTLSMADAPVSEWALGYQLLAGVDRPLTRRAAIGVKGRWTSVAAVSASIPWTMIRSHEPVHADGRTPFVWDYEFTGMGYFGASVEMRYVLR